MNVLLVERMTSLDFRERLRVEIVVKEHKFPFLLDETAPLLPPGQLGNKVIRRSLLDVHLETFLERRQASEDLVDFGNDLQIEIYGGVSPTQ